jgi:hypothetical protein
MLLALAAGCWLATTVCWPCMLALPACCRLPAGLVEAGITMSSLGDGGSGGGRQQLALRGAAAAAALGGAAAWWWWRSRGASGGASSSGSGHQGPAGEAEPDGAEGGGLGRPQWRLYQLGPMWGLPTMSPACLKVQAYMRFLRPGEGASWFETDSSGATHISPERTLPVLQDLQTGEVTACSAPIIRALQAATGTPQGASRAPYRGGAGDGLVGLTGGEAADQAAFGALVEHKLYLAMLYELWGCESTYQGVTYPALCEVLPFPLRCYLPRVIRARHLERIRHSRVHTPELAAAVGRECLAALAGRLGECPFFGGDQPSRCALRPAGSGLLLAACACKGLVARPPARFLPGVRAEIPLQWTRLTSEPAAGVPQFGRHGVRLPRADPQDAHQRQSA